MNIHDNIKKRIRIRSWRRGMKETDLILGKFIDESLNALSESELLCYERLLLEDDKNIFSWILQKEEVPAEFRLLIKKISEFTFNYHKKFNKKLY